MKTEGWLPVVGYEGEYEVSDFGRVRSLKTGTMMKPLPSKGGYVQVCLRTLGVAKWHLIHKLVLEAFVGPRPDGMEACHSPDSKGDNNSLGNLRWDTKVANLAECKPRKRRDYSNVVQMRRAGYSQSLIAARLGVSQPRVSLILKRLCSEGLLP